MLPRGVEIGVVADRRRQQHLDPRHRVESRLSRPRIVPQGRFIGSQQMGQPAPRFAPGLAAEGHECVEIRLPQRVAVAEAAAVEQTPVDQHRQIEHRITDRHADPRRETRRWAKDAVGEVVNGEVGVR